MATIRIQAPIAGINTDAAPDFIPASQAPALTNLLPGPDGKTVLRGAMTLSLGGITATTASPASYWAFDDWALAGGDAGSGYKTWRIDLNTSVGSASKTDVTATLVEVPTGYQHARFGAYVYGAVTDAASPQLGRWDGGATAIVPMANAPFRWTDLQVYAKRLFILGGTVPGTTTPIINGGRVLYWTDPDASDLSALATWQNDVSGLTEQLLYDGDDTPVALAGCGRFMAILGSRSINILTGSGSSSFAIRNLTRNWGCVSRESVVESDDGFYFNSNRGYCFCDGTTVRVVSDNAVTRELLAGSTPRFLSAAMYDTGYVALCNTNGNTGDAFLLNTKTGAWSKFSAAYNSTHPQGVFRTNLYPLLWQGGGFWVANKIATNQYSVRDLDFSLSAAPISASWSSRFITLSEPGQMMTVQRLLLDYKYMEGTVANSAWRVQLYDTLGNLLADSSSATSTTADRRQRFVLDVNAEADAVQLVVSFVPGASTSQISAAEIYSAWIEVAPGQQRGTI